MTLWTCPRCHLSIFPCACLVPPELSADDLTERDALNAAMNRANALTPAEQHERLMAVPLRPSPDPVGYGASHWTQGGRE